MKRIDSHIERNRGLFNNDRQVVVALILSLGFLGSMAKVTYDQEHDKSTDDIAAITKIQRQPNHFENTLARNYTRQVTYQNGEVSWYFDLGSTIKLSQEFCVGDSDTVIFSDGDISSGTLYLSNGENACADYRLELYDTYPRETSFEEGLFTVADPQIKP